MTSECVRIAYLAPALTALESTFVYEELLGLEARGFKVTPVSIHRPSRYVVGHDLLLERTYYLYDGGIFYVLMRGIRSLFGGRKQFRAAWHWFYGDFRAVSLPNGIKLIFQFLAACSLADLLKTQRCTHLHIHFAHVPAQVGMYAAAMSAIPFTVMAHANDIFERGLLLEKKAQRARKFLTISEFNKAHLEHVGVDGSRVAVVRCGVKFPARVTKKSFSLAHPPRIGTLGRLVEKKGIDVLMHAVAHLCDEGCAVDLVIAGDGELREELGKLAADLDIESHVRFEGGLPHNAVRDWLDGLDIFVLACKLDSNGDMDGIPVVLMEAMSQSVPVVSTHLSGIPELVIDGHTGLLAAPDDAYDLSQKLRQLILSHDMREQLANAAELHVRSEFGQDVNLDRLMGYIQGVKA